MPIVDLKYRDTGEQVGKEMAELSDNWEITYLTVNHDTCILKTECHQQSNLMDQFFYLHYYAAQ